MRYPSVILVPVDVDVGHAAVESGGTGAPDPVGEGVAAGLGDVAAFVGATELATLDLGVLAVGEGEARGCARSEFTANAPPPSSRITSAPTPTSNGTEVRFLGGGGARPGATGPPRQVPAPGGVVPRGKVARGAHLPWCW